MALFGFLEKKLSGKDLLSRLQKYNFIGTENRDKELKKIIEQGKNLEEPFSYLALAFASSFLKASERKNAIEYFEKYIRNPLPAPEKSFYDYQNVYGTLAKLYESEYKFEEAEKYYVLYYKETKNKLGYDHPHVTLGNLYLKISTQKAVDYWTAVKKEKPYSEDEEFKRLVDILYNEAMEKHQKGYVYKPRKRDK